MCEWCQAQFDPGYNAQQQQQAREFGKKEEIKSENKGDFRFVGYIVNFRFPSRFVFGDDIQGGVLSWRSGGQGEGCGPPYNVGWFVVHIRIRGFHWRDLPRFALDVHSLLLALDFSFRRKRGLCMGRVYTGHTQEVYFCPGTNVLSHSRWRHAMDRWPCSRLDQTFLGNAGCGASLMLYLVSGGR